MFRKSSSDDVYAEMERGKRAYEKRLSTQINLCNKIALLDKQIPLKIHAEQTGTEARYYQNDNVLGFQIISTPSAELQQQRDQLKAELDALNAEVKPRSPAPGK